VQEPALQRSPTAAGASPTASLTASPSAEEARPLGGGTGASEEPATGTDTGTGCRHQMPDDAVDKPTFVMRLSKTPRSASDRPRDSEPNDEGAAASSGEANGAERPLPSGSAVAGDGGWLMTRAAELRHWTSRGIDVAGAGLDMVTGGLAHGVVTVGGVARQSVEAASSSIFQVCGLRVPGCGLGWHLVCLCVRVA
jgi:hypothetical protein